MTASPLAPAHFGDTPMVRGVEIATHAAGLRYTGRADLFAARCCPGTVVAGTFTNSQCPSAPVQWCRGVLNHGVGPARALVVNAGNANAFTGKNGDTAAALTAQTIATAWDLSPQEVMLASTGVIGETLPTDSLTTGLGALAQNLVQPDRAGWEQAARAISTTDTFPKGAGRVLDLGGEVNVAGIAKGSGMIAPDMATMLGFIFTDATVDPELLHQMLVSSVADSYNRITVDSDTSTSDTVLLFASGASNAAPITEPDDPRAVTLAAAIDEVNLELAHLIVRDGEGATKFVTINVTGASDDRSAEVIALSIANSPLVKTALAASDANWGRIVMAVGKAGQPADRDRLGIWLGDEQCAANGVQAPGYSEARATEHLKGSDVECTVDLGIGSGRATVWTCDLTHGYIEINAGYRS